MLASGLGGTALDSLIGQPTQSFLAARPHTLRASVTLPALLASVSASELCGALFVEAKPPISWVLGHHSRILDAGGWKGPAVLRYLCQDELSARISAAGRPADSSSSGPD